MQHTIIELEDGALTMTVAGVTPRALAVETCVRMPLGHQPGEGLAAALRALGRSHPDALRRVHVLLGDRRSQHFTVQVPTMTQADLQATLLRESLRIAALPVGTDMLVRARRLPKEAGGRLQLGVTAVAGEVWEPLARALEANGTAVLSLHTIEDGIGQAIDSSLPSRTAVIEVSGSRARFVVCEDGAPTQVRRFLISGADSDDGIDTAVLGAQLALEVPRTLDYLREQGKASPEALLLSRRIGLGEDDLDLFAELGLRCVLARGDWQLAAGQEQPGLATIGILRALQRNRLPASLTASFHLRLPVPKSRILAAAALLVAAAFGGRLALEKRGDVAGMQRELSQLQGECARLVQEAIATTQPIDDGAGALASQVLGLRRPCSLVLASLCNAAPPGCQLQRVDIDRSVGVMVNGFVQEESRRAALAALSRFAGGVQAIPCVGSRGRDDVSELNGAANQLRFNFVLRWRKS